jgi:hypothetical protein
VPNGELAVRALRSSVGRLQRPEEILFESLGAVLVEMLIRLTECGESEPQLLCRRRKRVEELLSRVRGGVGHAVRLFTRVPSPVKLILCQ